MADDVKLMSMARKTIVKNWFDLSRIRVRVTRAVIHVQGRFYKLTGSPEEREGDQASLRKLDEDLHALSGARGVSYQIENWVHESSGTWRKIGGNKPLSKAAQKALSEGNQVG
jgi:hypothetical protein